MSSRMKRIVVVTIFSTLLISGNLTAQPQRGIPDSFDLDDQGRQPFKIFDNFYFVRTEFVSSYLLTTSDGLILIDALFDMAGYPEYLLGNVRQLGFDPADLKYVIITHGHRDHYGLGRELQDRTGATIGATAPDWTLIENEQGDRAPRRDWVIGQDETLTLGDATLRFDVTPGHTPGVVSIEFPVMDQGRGHTAYLHGGMNLRTDEPAAVERYIDDLERISAMEGIEVRLSNHPFIDDLFARADALAQRQPGEPHPFVAPEEFYAALNQAIAVARER